MSICRICGEVCSYVTLTKRLSWCEDCFKMYLEMKKERAAVYTFNKGPMEYTPASFTVTFD